MRDHDDALVFADRDFRRGRQLLEELLGGFFDAGTTYPEQVRVVFEAGDVGEGKARIVAKALDEASTLVVKGFIEA